MPTGSIAPRRQPPAETSFEYPLVASRDFRNRPLTHLDANLSDLLNPPVLENWLAEHVPELGQGPLSATQLSGGASNVVFKIDRGERLSLVLRRPPRHPRPGSNTIMMREARVLNALNGTNVPHPAFRAACGDTSVLGVQFYVMDFIDAWMGHGLPKNPPPYDDKTCIHYRRLPFALLDGIAKLCPIDYQKVGLADFGKPEKFLARQVDRWLGQLASYKTSDGYEGRKIEGFTYVADWLRANVPESRYIGIIHGDYSLANAMFAYETPPRLVAMVDWELATVGDTLLDLGWVLYGYRGCEEKSPTSGFFDSSPFANREELGAYYAEQSGHSIENLTYYMVLAQFKLATIMEGHVARARAGKQVSGSTAFVDRLIAKAQEMARGR
jgi:aminoglycoside phosphotransferase (APT) family kinase protein